MNINKLLYLLLLPFFVLSLGSCSFVQEDYSYLYDDESATSIALDRSLYSSSQSRYDVIHTVGPGETIWRLAKAYDVDANQIMEDNWISDVSSIRMGQRLRISEAAPMRPIIPLYPSKKWKYIIVHHTADESGSALSIYKVHRGKGWDNIGYHFVIDNGTENKEMGQIEISPRWIKQKDGAHCKAGDMNVKGIGVSLVGNFSESRHVPREQMDSLVYLVNKLRREYNIPLENVIGHGKVHGAHTECPGLHFPFDEFKRRLIREY